MQQKVPTRTPENEANASSFDGSSFNASSFEVEEAMAIAVYVDDLPTGIDFYGRVLGLRRYKESGEKFCFFYLGENPNGLYLEGGHTRSGINNTSARVSVMLSVDSVGNLHKRLRAEGVHCVQPSPVRLGENSYWLQFYDPSGNLLEAVGGA